MNTQLNIYIKLKVGRSLEDAYVLLLVKRATRINPIHLNLIF